MGEMDKDEHGMMFVSTVAYAAALQCLCVNKPTMERKESKVNGGRCIVAVKLAARSSKDVGTVGTSGKINVDVEVTDGK